ncbi:MAG TPA: hypothetical protein VF992_09350 [Thermoplasmata archaeon]
MKRLRLVAFLAASSIATQIVLRNFLGYVGLGDLLPSSIVTILIASAVWLVAYPAMWMRMLTVVVEMEAKKEYGALLQEIHKLHHHSSQEGAAPGLASPSLRDDTASRKM